MITAVDAYFEKGCGRCERFATTDCSTRPWIDGLLALRRICLDVGLRERAKWGHPCYLHAGRNVTVLGAFRGDSGKGKRNGKLNVLYAASGDFRGWAQRRVLMSSTWFKFIVGAIGLGFALFFLGTVVPPLVRHPDIVGAFGAGFVNPYASGYAMDAIACWGILTAWVLHEARTTDIRYGWVAILLGIAPGVATGFGFYLLLRMRYRAH